MTRRFFDPLNIFFLILALAPLEAFIVLSILGYQMPKGESYAKIDKCYRGTQVVLNFGGMNQFNYLDVSAGPKFFRYRVRGVSWPGGVFGVTTINRNLCPDATEEEMEVDTQKDMIRHPDRYIDEDGSNG